MALNIKFVDSDPFDQLTQLETYDVVFFDLERLGFEKVFDWILRARPSQPPEPQDVLPVIVVFAELSELRPRHRQSLLDAGAALYDKPAELPPSGDWQAYLEEKLNETYSGADFFEHEWGFQFKRRESNPERYPNEPNHTRGTGGRSGEDHLTEDDAHDDLSIYIEPPVQVSPDDYARLLNRMQSPDEDWRKDD